MGRESRKNLSGELEFERTPERPARLSGGSILQVTGTASAEFRQGGGGGAAGGSGRALTEGSGETGAWGQQERTGSGQRCWKTAGDASGRGPQVWGRRQPDSDRARGARQAGRRRRSVMGRCAAGGLAESLSHHGEARAGGQEHRRQRT